ncbi:hypothetical protein EAF04_000780 [Stromatinia cepivora]|nr:hypothetical protein EAF04_000780 [Stromatinia cepivora]
MKCGGNFLNHQGGANVAQAQCYGLSARPDISPSNKAAVGKNDVVTALLSYHVLNGCYPASTLNQNAQFVPTLLTNRTYTQVTGGQVVEIASNGTKACITTGLKETNGTQERDIMFTNGVLHIIDTLSCRCTYKYIPCKPSQYSWGYNDFCTFAWAFQNIGNTAASLPSVQLAAILNYHVVNGTVGYSTLLTSGLANESLPTLGTTRLTVTSETAPQKIFINSAMIISTDILTPSGVFHVIDNVLNPTNTSIVSNPRALPQPLAFAGAMGAASPSFTSGIVPTTTASSARTGGRCRGLVGRGGSEWVVWGRDRRRERGQEEMEGEGSDGEW